jgi:hypothetical protein
MPDEAPKWSINPIALAQLLIGKRLVLEKDRSEPERVQDLLETAFKTKLDAIFEAEGDTPARLDLFQKLADSVGSAGSVRPQELANTLHLTLVQDLVQSYGQEAIRRVVPYLVPVADATFTLAGAPPSPAGSGAVTGSWGAVADNDYIVTDISYLDPVQGPIADCYLISSMISLAWSRPAQWTASVTATKQASHKYSYQLYEATAANPTVIDLQPQLPLDSNAQFAYARSASPAETWPAMFEKAYVILRRNLSVEPTPSDYVNIGWGQPQVACRALIGGVSRHEPDVGDNLSKEVRKHCDGRGVTNEPTMAWTADYATIHNRGFTWKGTALRREHAYAVLGVMNRGNRDYVVLRDPWGWVNTSAVHATGGPWTPGPGASGVQSVELDRGRGVFALQASVFDKCFQAVGWVQ